MEVFELLGKVPLGDLGFASITLLGIWLIFTGKLVPRQLAAKTEDLLQEQVKTWRDAYDKSETARGEMTRQMSELLEQAKTTNTLLQAIPKKRTEAKP